MNRRNFHKRREQEGGFEQEGTEGTERRDEAAMG
jgi:hypothetical protein